MVSVGAVEVAVALISLIASTAISEDQMQRQNTRTARATQISSWYDAIEKKLNISYDQLNQAAEMLGIQLSRIEDAARGSARLSKASQRSREFIREYPDLLNKINSTKNLIQNEANKIDAKQQNAVSLVTKGSSFNQMDAAKDIHDNVQKVNTAIGDINNMFTKSKVISTKQPEVSSDTDSQIDTTLTNQKYNRWSDTNNWEYDPSVKGKTIKKKGYYTVPEYDGYIYKGEWDSVNKPRPVVPSEITDHYSK